MINKFKKILLTTSAITLSITFSFAQLQDQQASIELSPASPRIGDNYTATVQSYAFDVDRADISWILDGKVIEKGFGKRGVELVMGKNNKSLLVKATTPEGKIYTGGVSLLEKSVSIIFEGRDSYIPAWYKGKRQIARGGDARVVAIANISDGKNYIDNKDLVFTWEVDGVIADKQSGLGKYYADLRILDEYGDNVNISVTVKPRLTGESVKSYIDITSYDPLLLFYKYDALTGLNTNVLGAETVANNELQLVAEPYFFSVDSLKLNEMLYEWSINGKVQSGNSYSRVFKSGDKKGVADISLTATQNKRLLQDANRSIIINF